MPANHDTGQRIEKLIDAFEQDNFLVDRDHDVKIFQGKIGICARHYSAVNYETGEAKRTFYVEGSPYQMGFLMGLMAEESVSRMATTFVDHIPFAFLGLKISPSLLERIINKILSWIVNRWIKNTIRDIPGEYHDELRGLLDGCREANPGTRVNMDDLWMLNVGIDAILAHVYPGKLLGLGRWIRESLKIPVMCNAFSAFGNATKSGSAHYFGRDFMFPDAGVFRNVACLVIYNPDPQPGRNPMPIVSQTAPGMIGAIACMNLHGVAMGIDMVPSAACNPHRPGFNSLLLSRHAVHYGSRVEDVVDIIAEAPRGVSWLYAVSDGTRDRAAVIEAVEKLEFKNDNRLVRYLLSFPPRRYRKHLPGCEDIQKQLKNYSQRERDLLRKGVAVRWSDRRVCGEYLRYNDGLRVQYNESLLLLYEIPPFYGDAFNSDGFVNLHYTDTRCPGTFYFSPQREDRDDVVLASNNFIVPELRLTSMRPWTAQLAASEVNDIQWRYDRLNKLLLEHAGSPDGGLDYDTARSLIDFLSPQRAFNSCYYDRFQRSPDFKEIAIFGSTSIFDLKAKTIESHFGYHCDGWIKISLARYVQETIKTK